MRATRQEILAGYLPDYSSVVWRRLRGRLTVDRGRGCCVRYNVETRKHARRRPELVVIRVHNIVQSRLVRRIDIKCLTPDGQSAHGSDSHNHDAAERADIFSSADLDRPVFDHHGRSLCGQYRIQIRLTNPSQFCLHRQSKNRSGSRINRQFSEVSGRHQKGTPTHKAAVRDVVMRVLGAHDVAKDCLPSSFALYPTAPDQYAIAARGIYEHGAKNRTENTDEIEVLFPGARAALLLLCILFLMAVPIAESCFLRHRLAQRLIGPDGLPG